MHFSSGVAFLQYKTSACFDVNQRGKNLVFETLKRCVLHQNLGGIGQHVASHHIAVICTVEQLSVFEDEEEKNIILDTQYISSTVSWSLSQNKETGMFYHDNIQLAVHYYKAIYQLNNQ